ncbi:hypothetical protein BJ138DRAFT_1109873 [Hygrophoropsis aurantiaca]|uniref:Uncharacterized protein n=1 Tax=Hygrophoropsis aurantiaca TaxID=72124 RepID=A0ACB8AP89_9AGAM|nr:hypothetical protein BJ138DRAFT_1109873 [Hygrophoropsis aurantiaca]
MPNQMDSKAAARIQSHADKSGTNQGFKARAQRASAKNAKDTAPSSGEGSSSSGGGSGGSKSSSEGGGGGGKGEDQKDNSGKGSGDSKGDGKK